ncbi:hypothetical protein CGCTS75_v005066 [Colletotrichum tropicale]|nr:hypothetical protein CGCTS75_v005066 [Colletotrichum tropicale]
MSLHAARFARQLSHRPLPVLQARLASTQPLSRELFPQRTQSQPGDWPKLIKKAGVRVAQYVGVFSVVLFWPYPVYTIAEAIY